MKIVFVSPDTRHPESDYYNNSDNDTIDEVAARLEDKYALIQQFIQDNTSAIMDIVIKNKLDYVVHKISKSESDKNISESIIDMYREWIYDNSTPYESKRALKIGGITFVDTGAYIDTMKIEIEE